MAALLILICLMSSSLLLLYGNEQVDAVPPARVRELSHTEWLILVYIAGDNDLGTNGEYGNAALMDIEEMERSIPDSGVRVLALTDLQGPSNTKLYNIRPDDTSGVNSPTIPLSNIHSTWIDEVDMGDDRTLERFITYSLTNYSYDRSMFVMWDHGSGWYFESDISRPPSSRGFAQDVEDGSIMYLDEMRDAFIRTENNIGPFKFDIIGHDTCYMGMLEVFYQLSRWSSIATGSMDEQPWYGYNYTFISTLEGIGPHHPRDLVLNMIALFSQEYSSSSSTYHTIAAADVDILSSSFLQSFEKLARSLMFRMYHLENDRYGSFSKIELSTEGITIDNLDVGSFLVELRDGGLGQNITTLANDTLSIYNEMLIGSWIKPGGRNPKGTGISVYMPNKELPYKSQYDGDRDFLNFTGDTSWDEMIREYRDPVERLRVELRIIENPSRTISHDLEVTVLDTQQSLPSPVEGAEVWINGEFGGLTSVDGTLIFSDIEPGRYSVEASMEELVDIADIKALNRPPVAMISPEDPTIGEGMTLRLNGTLSFDPDGDLVTYIWDLDHTDGLNDSDQTTPFVNFIAHDEGVYPVRLTVNDSDLESVMDVNITVTNLNPEVDLVIRDDIFEDETFIIDGSGSRDSIVDMELLEYRFSLDGVVIREWSTLSMIQTSISTSGDHIALLEVRDEDGGYSNGSLTIQVNNVIPVAIINGPSTALEDEPVTFFANGSFDTPSDMDDLMFGWSIDGVSIMLSENETFTTIFETSGNHEVALVVYDGNPDDGSTGMNLTNMTIRIDNVIPIPFFMIPEKLNESQEIQLNASGTYDTISDRNGLNYSWFLDGDPFGSGADRGNVLFYEPGFHTISLEVIDDDGAIGRIDRTLEIVNVLPTVNIELQNVTWEDDPLNITILEPFDTEYDMDVLSVKWYIGPNLTAEGLVKEIVEGSVGYYPPDVVPTISGKTTLKVVVTDDQGETVSKELELMVRNPPPNVLLSGIPKKVSVDEKFTAFGYLSSDNPSDMDTLEFRWLVDGEMKEGLTEKNATFEFSTPGARTITLQVIDDDGEMRQASLTVETEEEPFLEKFIEIVFSGVGLLIIIVLLVLIIILVARINGKVNELKSPNREKVKEEDEAQDGEPDDDGEEDPENEEDPLDEDEMDDEGSIEGDLEEEGPMGDVEDLDIPEPEDMEPPDLPSPPVIEDLDIPDFEDPGEEPSIQ